MKIKELQKVLEKRDAVTYKACKKDDSYLVIRAQEEVGEIAKAWKKKEKFREFPNSVNKELKQKVEKAGFTSAEQYYKENLVEECADTIFICLLKMTQSGADAEQVIKKVFNRRSKELKVDIKI